MNLILKLLLGRDIIALISEYYHFKEKSSEGGKELTRSEKLHLVYRAGQIVEKLITKLKIGAKK